MGTRGAAIRLTPQATKNSNSLIQPVLQEETRAAAAVNAEAEAVKTEETSTKSTKSTKSTATATE